MLFLLGCLQMKEEDRMDAAALLTQPFVSQEFAAYRLHEPEAICRSSKGDRGHVELTASDSSMSGMLAE